MLVYIKALELLDVICHFIVLQVLMKVSVLVAACGID
jgi:hypothetical protein